jgi:uncharacterized membrane protein YqjE
MTSITKTLVNLGIAQISNKKEQTVSRLLFFIPLTLSFITIIFVLISFHGFLNVYFSDVSANFIFAVCFLFLSLISWFVIYLKLKRLEQKKVKQSQSIDYLVKDLIQNYTKNAVSISEVSQRSTS